jgi:hypothetical protein
VQTPRRQPPPEKRRGKRNEVRRVHEAEGGTAPRGEGAAAPR